MAPSADQETMWLRLGPFSFPSLPLNCHYLYRCLSLKTKIKSNPLLYKSSRKTEGASSIAQVVGEALSSNPVLGEKMVQCGAMVGEDRL
jgi:hypothetical protein